jgi:hypothetical protein
MMLIRQLKMLAAGSLLALITTQTFASGSIGSSAPRAQGGKSYTMGKQVYMKKIACAQCKVPGGVTNASDAKALATRLDSEEFTLTEQERMDTKKYLMRRFKF